MVQTVLLFNFKSSLPLFRLQQLTPSEKLHLHFGTGVYPYHLVRVYYMPGVARLEVREGPATGPLGDRMPLRDLY